MKFFGVVLFFAICCRVFAMHVFFGDKMGDSEELLFRRQVVKEKSSFVKVAEPISFPLDEDCNNYTINYIHVTDNIADNNGADAFILEGGTSDDFVYMVLVSQQAQPINSTVEIYGRRL